MKNKIKWYHHKENIVFFLLFFLVTVVYFLIPVFVMPDSVEYYNYLKIFQGVAPMSTWKVVRGPTFPLIVFWGTRMFGDNIRGILMLTYLFFLSFLTFSYFFIQKVLQTFFVSKAKIFIIYFLYYLFVSLNPILFGYFHGFLTEFVAILFLFISPILCWKWLGISSKKSKRKYILYNILFIFLFIFLWFLKQPYVSGILFSLLIACTISIYNEFSLQNVTQRLATVLICLLSLGGGILSWNKILETNNVNSKGQSTSQFFLNNTIIKGIPNIQFESELGLEVVNYMEDSYLSGKDKEKINNILENDSGKSFEIIQILSHDGELMNKMVIYFDGDTFSTKDAIIFWLKVVAEHPKTVVEGYFANYLAMINIYVSTRDDKGRYYPVREFLNFDHENRTIGLSYLQNDGNFLWIRDEHYDSIGHLYAENNKNIFAGKIFQIYVKFHLIIFKIIFAILPFLLIFSIVRYITTLKQMDLKTKNYYCLVIILLGFSFLHALFHAVTGAIIDRYVYVVLPEIVLAIIILLILRIRKKKM